MRPFFALYLLYVPAARAAKLQWSPKDLFIFAEEIITQNGCSSFQCPENYRPKYDPQGTTENASTEICCSPTCALWNCSSGYKANAHYFANLAESDNACCDLTCALFTKCPAGSAVPAELTSVTGATVSECCRPKCSQHSCYGLWAQDLSKKDLSADTDSECCQPSCASVICNENSGLSHHEDRIDKAGSTTEYCCQKRCRYYLSQCPNHQSVPQSKMDTKLEAISSSDALSKCCEDKCSGVVCSSGYILRNSPIQDMFVHEANFYGGCCYKTCAAYTCSSGWTAAAARVNNTMPSDANCCEPKAATCADYDCRLVGLYNVTDANTLAITNTSRHNCCSQHTCQTFECPAGTTAKAGSTSSSVCCESKICSEMREAGRLAVDECDGLDEGTCSASYRSVNSSGTLTLTPCEWDATLSNCSWSDTESADDCAAM